MTNKRELPQDLLKHARKLSGELAWSLVDVDEVISWLEANDISILGVELWREEDGSPVWIASSSYDVNTVIPGKKVEYGSQQARKFVDQFRTEDNVLFNLSW